MSQGEQAPLERRYYRREEVAYITVLNRSQIDKMLAEADLQKVKVGRAVLIPAAEVDRLFPA